MVGAELVGTGELGLWRVAAIPGKRFVVLVGTEMVVPDAVYLEVHEGYEEMEEVEDEDERG